MFLFDKVIFGISKLLSFEIRQGKTDINAFVTSNVRHAFTGHEDLGEVGLIHMNGRLYDPAIGRFISADPTIQYPDDMQNYNRYSYINNNPLAAVDYSGYGWNPFKKLKKLFKKLFKAVKSILRNKIVRLAATIAIATFAPEFIGSTNVFGGALKQYADVIAGGMSGLVSGRGDLRAAIQGAVTAGAMGLVGDAAPVAGSFANVAGHAAVGCASSVASGGSCGSGALSGGFSAGAAKYASGFGGYGGAVVSAVVGGTASVLGGGKFENGAMTGAFGYLFNCMAHKAGCASDNGLKKERELWKAQLALDEKGIQPVYLVEEAVFSFMGGKVGVEILTNAPRIVNYIDKYSDIIYYGFEAAAAILGSASPIATDTMLPRQEYVNLSNSYDINKQQEFIKNSQRPFKIPIRIKKFP